MDWSVKKRTGKVFFDHNMNARGKTLASVYSTRNSPEATVSTPISWHEIDSIYPTDFSLRTVQDRLCELGDLWSDILEKKNDLKDLPGLTSEKSAYTKNAPLEGDRVRRKKK